MTLQLLPIPALQDNYIWALINTSLARVMIVDPGEARPVMDYLKQAQLKLEGIVITHHHFDHTAGVVEIVKHLPVPVWGPSHSTIVGVTHPLQAHDRVQLNHAFPSFEVMAIPGHTLDHIAYYTKGILFCGDTLFAAGCGRLFEGSAEQLFASLQQIAHLPDDTQICCAHEYTLNNLRFALCVEPDNQEIVRRIERVKALRAADKPSLPSLLMDEKKTNPFLRCHVQALIAQVEAYAQCTLSEPVDVFAQLRRWKDHF